MATQDYPTPFLTNPSQIRGVTWAKGYLWACQIPSAPNPFNMWFPATDYTEEIYAPGQTRRIVVGHQVVEILGDMEESTVKVDFPDNDQCVLLDWLETWVNGVLYRKDGTVATLTEGTILMRFARLDYQRRIVQMRNVWVYPKNKVDVTYGSDVTTPFVNLSCTFGISQLSIQSASEFQ